MFALKCKYVFPNKVIMALLYTIAIKVYEKYVTNDVISVRHFKFNIK